MSSSHGNLLSLVPSSNVVFDSADSLAETIDSRRVEVNFDLRPPPLRDCSTPATSEPRKEKQGKKPLSLTEKKKSPSIAKSPPGIEATKCQSDERDREDQGAYEWLSFVRRKKPEQTSHKKRLPSNARLTNVHNEVDPAVVQLDRCKAISGATMKSSPKETVYALLKITHRYVTEVDLWSIWRSCLLNRLRRILYVEDLSFISWEVVGQDVKWNCQRVGTSGIVKPRTDREDFSGYVMRLMRYLEQFPFPSGTSNVIIYKDKQEVNVFKTVCSRLSRDSPLLSVAEASALIHVISWCKERDTSKNIPDTQHSIHRSSLHIETEFTEDAPRSRVVPRPLSTAISQRILSTSSGNSSCSSFGEHLEPAVVTSNNPMRGSNRKNLQVLAENVTMGTSALMKRLDEMCLESHSNEEMTESIELPDFTEFAPEQSQSSPGYSSASISSYKTANTTTLIAGVNEEFVSKPSQVSFEALALILLTLPPSRRRRLHHLIRFMNKIAANHCLQLDEHHSNRYAVLKGLSGSIISLGVGPSSLSPSQSIYLVTILLDYENEIFTVPDGLLVDVDIAIRERQRERVIPAEPYTECSSKPTNSVQFCEPIQVEDYDNQQRYLEENLLELLEQICSDENLTISEKRKRLKKVRFIFSNL
ncbi:hypothetical protein Aduo_005481 [Ancylostoma duodenale]